MQIVGRIHRGVIQSQILRGNPAGEIPERPTIVYVPPLTDASETFPVLYYLSGWLGAGRTFADWRPFRESLPERLERLVKAGKVPPCVVVAVDLYTSYGGSQYINSEFFGAHGDHIVKELIPFVEKNFPVKPGQGHRGVFGKSSGGFGALRLAMDFPGAFAAVGCHSGDMGFDLLFGSGFVDLPNALARYERDPRKFYEHCRTAGKISGRDMHVLMLLGNAGFYSPDAGSALGYQLPIDLYSGALQPGVLARWRQHDPVVRLDDAKAGLENLRCLYLECGNRDQYNLVYGARQLHQKLEAAKIAHKYCEFDDDHSATDYRYDVSLPLLGAALVG